MIRLDSVANKTALTVNWLFHMSRNPTRARRRLGAVLKSSNLDVVALI